MPLKVELTQDWVVVYAKGPAKIEARFHWPQDAQKWCSEHKCTWQKDEWVEVWVPESEYEVVRFDAQEVARITVSSKEGVIRVLP